MIKQRQLTRRSLCRNDFPFVNLISFWGALNKGHSQFKKKKERNMNGGTAWSCSKIVCDKRRVSTFWREILTKSCWYNRTDSFLRRTLLLVLSTGKFAVSEYDQGVLVGVGVHLSCTGCPMWKHSCFELPAQWVVRTCITFWNQALVGEVQHICPEKWTAKYVFSHKAHPNQMANAFYRRQLLQF